MKKSKKLFAVFSAIVLRVFDFSRIGAYFVVMKKIYGGASEGEPSEKNPEKEFLTGNVKKKRRRMPLSVR